MTPEFEYPTSQSVFETEMANFNRFLAKRGYLSGVVLAVLHMLSPENAQEFSSIAVLPKQQTRFTEQTTRSKRTPREPWLRSKVLPPWKKFDAVRILNMAKCVEPTRREGDHSFFRRTFSPFDRNTGTTPCEIQECPHTKGACPVYSALSAAKNR